MVLVECPWCDGALALDAGASEVRCDRCGVDLELSPDPVRERFEVAA